MQQPTVPPPLSASYDGRPTPGVERDLFRRLRLAGDRSARDEIVRRFLPLARHLARRYRSQTEPLEDLEQVASLALVKAVDRFDISRGTAFSSFLVPTVLGELKRHFRDSSWAAHVPRRVQERVMTVTRTMGDLASERGQSPTLSEVAGATDYSVEEVLEAMEAARAYRAGSLEAVGSGEDEDRQDSLPELGRQEGGYELVELGASMRAAVMSLPERERKILRLRFIDDMTQSQIAELVGISQMHVSRLIRGAVDRLEEAVDEDAVSHSVEHQTRSAASGV